MSFDNQLWTERAMQFALANQEKATEETVSSKANDSMVDISVLDQFIPGENQHQANPATT